MAKLTSRQKEARRLAEWKKFLKDESDWDWAPILRVLAYKIRRTRKFLTSAQAASIPPRGPMIKIMKQVEDLLEKVSRDEYSNVYDWKNIKLEHVKDDWHLKPKVRAEVRRRLKQADKDRDKDLRKAFDLIATHIYEWWD